MDSLPGRVVPRLSLLMLAALLSGCVARPTGDFGRAAPSYLHDELMPEVGRARAQLTGDAVSSFRQTDEEGEMHDRIWRFLVSQHARDWMFDVRAQLKRSRLVVETPVERSAIDRYYLKLKRAEYASSRVRYSTIAAEIDTDVATIPDTFRAICAVLEIDRQRQVALAALRPNDPNLASEVSARIGENAAAIAWFVKALRYRYDSYSYALDTFLIETPHPEAANVQQQLDRLRPLVARAEAGDFCSGVDAKDRWTGTAIPSRYSHWADDTGAVGIK